MSDSVKAEQGGLRPVVGNCGVTSNVHNTSLPLKGNFGGVPLAQLGGEISLPNKSGVPLSAAPTNSNASSGQEAEKRSEAEASSKPQQLEDNDSMDGEESVLGLLRWEKQRRRWRHRTAEQELLHKAHL